MLNDAQIVNLVRNYPKSIGFLNAFRSPDDETSIAKGIPVNAVTLAEVAEIRKIIPINVKYRGPRRPGFLGQATCLKKDATTFAIYPK
jgi:hypothetical protein